MYSLQNRHFFWAFWALIPNLTSFMTSVECKVWVAQAQDFEARRWVAKNRPCVVGVGNLDFQVLLLKTAKIWLQILNFRRPSAGSGGWVPDFYCGEAGSFTEQFSVFHFLLRRSRQSYGAIFRLFLVPFFVAVH